MQNKQHKLILASASPARAALLAGAGLEFTINPANIDEDEIKREFLSATEQPAENLAHILAEQKARAISRIEGGAYIIGADQILVYENRILNKPASRKKAKAQLEELRGKTHFLTSAVSLAKNDECIWTYSQSAEMSMRCFSDDFLEEYLQIAGKEIHGCVGGYQLEGAGAQLFSSVKGDYFTVLGLPLLALLDILRDEKVLIS